MKNLKKRFGKFAVSHTKAKNITGGFIAIDPWDGLGGGSGEPTCRWACSYSDSSHPIQRSQICPDEPSANEFKRSMENLGYSVSCFPLC
ncbi:hypothetical protein V9L05_12815 [Bernardetia sp. Wsw4-3y2]|uniref:hypothetical protein n=1 Tax=Bernardetia sp. Wsw4-3y2 TaxID=3127471 RepID=UPI0030D56C51